VGEFEKVAQPSFFEFGKALEVVESFHSTNHRGQRDEKDFAKVVTLCPAVAGIDEVFKSFHAGRKSSCIVFIKGLIASYPACLDHKIALCGWGLHKNEVALTRASPHPQNLQRETF
jgi:hypothetical protein